MAATPPHLPAPPHPFSAVEYLALASAVDRLELEAGEPEAELHLRQSARSARRALGKVYEQLRPGARRDLDRRTGRA